MSSNKISRILSVLFVAFLGVALRAWHLGVVQRETRWIEAQKPQSKTLLLRADRGTICDRFQIPMALNRICYNASIYLSPIAQIPASRWQEDGMGKRERVWPRKEYIRALSEKLGSELEMDPERLEDLIYANAFLFPHAPYILKAHLSEETYFRLKGLERDWPGLQAEIGAERFYPLGKTGCHIVGTMGAISQKRYRKIADELRELQEAALLFEHGESVSLPNGYGSFGEVYERLHQLKEKAYTLTDLVGKTGIEGQFEEDLRGYFGKKLFEVDQKGRFVRELPGGREKVAGRRITLSISAELQQFAEELLAMYEKERDGRSIGLDPVDKKWKKQKQPWMKGGAIVAIDPNNGEVLAMASYPRFDPNDFIPSDGGRQTRLARWMENERYMAALWDGEAPLCRERFQRRFFDEEAFLSWSLYLDLILPEDGPIKTFFQKVDDVKGAIQVQEDFEKLHYVFGRPDPSQIAEGFGKKAPELSDGKLAWRRLDSLLSPIPDARDRLFAIDLCRLIVDSTRFSDELIGKVGSMKLETYRFLATECIQLENGVKKKEFEVFHRDHFSAWRAKNQKSFLAEVRKKEKEKKWFARPYLDYLDRKERELFADHWNDLRLQILREHLAGPLCEATQTFSSELTEDFLRTFRNFAKLDSPLLGRYSKWKTEKELAGAVIPKGGFGSIRSYAFQTSAPQGSVFKLVTSYEGLRQGHSPVIVDNQAKDGRMVAYGLNGAPYPRLYKGGRLPRSSNPQVGKIDLVGALEQSSNPYFSILAGDFFSDPEDLKRAALQFGYGEKSGLELPGETAGNLPSDLKTNRTGLYSFAIGQHTLLVTPIQAAIALSAIGNGGKVFQPKIVLASTGLSPDRKELSMFSIKNSFAEEELTALGIPFSLFTGVQSQEPLAEAEPLLTRTRKTLSLPPSIRMPLLEGMDRTIWGEKGGARPSSLRMLRTHPHLSSEFMSLQHQMIGKNGTAQILFNPNANPSSPAQMVKHTWFGALSFVPEYSGKARYDHPELVVVVFSRFADAGKQSAPIAAQMVKKWREIKKKHEL